MKLQVRQAPLSVFEPPVFVIVAVPVHRGRAEVIAVGKKQVVFHRPDGADFLFRDDVDLVDLVNGPGPGEVGLGGGKEFVEGIEFSQRDSVFAEEADGGFTSEQRSELHPILGVHVSAVASLRRSVSTNAKWFCNWNLLFAPPYSDEQQELSVTIVPSFGSIVHHRNI